MRAGAVLQVYLSDIVLQESFFSQASRCSLCDSPVPKNMFRLWGNCSILFPEVLGNTDIIGKTDVGEHAILSGFPIVKTPNSNSRSKQTPHVTNSAPTMSEFFA